MKDPTYVAFDGMTWPNPADPLEVEWSLRYGAPSREQMLVAASVVAAYRQLVEDPQRIRNGKVATLRQALAAAEQPGPAHGGTVATQEPALVLARRLCEQDGCSDPAPCPDHVTAAGAALKSARRTRRGGNAMIVNLTPHPIRVYHPNTPDRIVIDGGHEPLFVVEPSGQLARLGMEEVATGAFVQHSGLPAPLHYIDYGGVNGLPDYDGSADGEQPRTYYVVSTIVALAVRGRSDIVAPYREVRDLNGTVIGCRALARPV